MADPRTPQQRPNEGGSDDRLPTDTESHDASTSDDEPPPDRDGVQAAELMD